MPRQLKTLFAGASLALLLAAAGCQHKVEPPPPPPAAALTVGDGLTDPIGFGEANPVFSWKLRDDIRAQSAYDLQVTAGGKLWDSGWIESDQTVRVPYEGTALSSREPVEWRVAIRDEDGDDRGWSVPAHFEMGLLSPADWKAQWIRPSGERPVDQEPVASLRRTFPVKQKVAHARIYVTARGVFELSVNGLGVGRDHFANGWTSYHNRIDTLTYDVTSQLKSGSNTIDALLGAGWYAGRVGFDKSKPKGIYGTDPQLLLQLEVTYQDGTTETIASDDKWLGTYDGPVRSSSIYDGEEYDANRLATGWQPVVAEAELGAQRLLPKPFAPVREVEKGVANGVTEPTPGNYVFDLGQNMVGWARIRIPVEKGKTITVHYAEMLNKDGTPYMANYRTAKSTDSYTAAKTENIDWQPHFTFHGFRYVQLSGIKVPADKKPAKEWVTGVVLHSDLTQTGRFDSSSAKLNKLQSNIVWGQRGNFVDVPTDCPQRDERLGWTGDAEVFTPTAMFNYDALGFWRSWLASMRDDQLPEGQIPRVIPNVLPAPEPCSPGWMDAATIIPWEVYVRTGDQQILAENFEMMSKLVGWYRSQATDGITQNIKGYGDWLQPYAKTNKGDTPFALLGTAYYARSAQIIAKAAEVLGRDEEAKRYTAEAESVRRAFYAQYFDSTGTIRNAPETQTAYVLAIAFDLVPVGARDKVGANLVRLVTQAGKHLQTGFLGTPYIARALDESGHPDLAYDLLFQETYPSWFYPINQGATTMWERWNSFTRDKGFGDVGMNSFNHYAYGAIGQWMYERVAGLTPDPAHPGYKHFFVRPLLGKQLTAARAELDTPYGTAVSGWTKYTASVALEVVVPPGTTATVEFPDKRPDLVLTAGTYHFDSALEPPKPLGIKMFGSN